MNKSHIVLSCLVGVFVCTHAWGASSGTGSVFCGMYPCLIYNSSGECTKCDCSSVSCPSGQTKTATCGCTSLGGGGGDGVIKRACAVGEYWMSSFGCVACPMPGTSSGGSRSGAVIENPSLADCYIPSGATFTDDTGTGTYTADCKYSYL